MVGRRHFLRNHLRKREEKGKENWLKRRDLGKNKESQVGRKRKNRGEN